MTKPTITQERLKELVRYDPDTGSITWIVRRGNRAAGKPWGCSDDRGYALGMLDKRFYRGHQVAFIYMTGELPANDIDHINGDKSDNRWANLRACTRAENLCNTHKLRSNNTSGFTGVAATPNGKWVAQAKLRGGYTYLGRYKTKAEAAAAYDKAVLADRGEFATLNFPQESPS